ncbi:hypothetical protein ABH931_006678 [Streptacidiphilus sp. MAP12-33]
MPGDVGGERARPDETTAWAARAFLLLAEDGRIREDYHLTVQALTDA